MFKLSTSLFILILTKKSVYFIDRKKIGLINIRNEDLIRNIFLIKNKKLFYRNKINKLRKERIIYLKSSMERSIYLIKKILYSE